ncbi:MAG: hypothetical protein AB7P20_03055 [Rhizobiaceae bacterium]
MFDDQKDLEDWLEPLGYDAFWQAIDPLGLDIEERWSIDAQIEKGAVTEAIVLKVLKGMTRLQIIERLGLRPHHPHHWHALH